MDAAEYIRKAKKATRLSKGLSDEEFEMFFWDNLHLPSPLYGCDVKGSLFDANDGYPWNLRKLGTCLQDGLGKTTLDGINTPYLYFGNFRSMFAWHVEDLNLGSINFQHYGKPKYWYGVSKKVSPLFGLISSTIENLRPMSNQNFKKEI
jgi:jumonji domain-containing protein 2